MIKNIGEIKESGELLKESLYDKSISDFQLWQKFKEGNVHAYSLIYAKYVKVLFNYSRNICKDEELVKDCIQDLFIEIWKNKENLGNTDSIKYYLYKSIRRKIVYELNRLKNKCEVSLEDEKETEVAIPHEVKLISDQISKENKEKLKRAVDSLSARQREIVLLLFYDNLKYQEVASIMAINLRSVYTLAWKAIESLKQHLGKLHFIFLILTIVY